MPTVGVAGDFHAGPLFEKFDLTLGSGHGTEAVGPLFYETQKETEKIWAFPPVMSYARDPESGLKEFDFLYPILAYDRYGDQYHWQLLQLFSFSGGPTQLEPEKHRFMLFPLYFQQRSSDPTQNYTALFPIYGHLRRHLFRDEIYFVMFPIFSETKKKDMVTDNYVYPLFHLRHGDGLTGWQFWPIAGSETKEVTTRTNGFGDVEMVPAHDSVFVLWPFYLKDRMALGTTNATWQFASLPFFSMVRSASRDATTVIWPFFTHIDDRGQQFKEWDAPWPFVEFAHGEGKTTTRVWPIYSKSFSTNQESDFYLWPIYKYNWSTGTDLERKRTRLVFFLYSDRKDKNLETGHSRRRLDLWPLILYQRDFNGSSRLQMIAPLEVFASGSHKVQRDYSPLWSIWRSEKNPKAGAASQSLLWNLYRHETRPESKKCSLLFGLFQYQSGSEGKRVRLFYIPMGGAKAAAPKSEAVKSP